MSTIRPKRGNVRKRRDSRERTVLMGTGALALVILLALLYVAFKAPSGIPLKPYYSVSAQFKSLGTLDTGADVTVAGKLVGQVVDLRLEHGVPTVDLQLNEGTPKLPEGTTARIRPRGLLGAEYVDLTPSRSRQTIPDNGTIPAIDTSNADQISDLFATFDAPARTHLSEMINGLGQGLLGRGQQLNQTIATAPGVLENLTRGLTPLINDTGATATFISGANSVMAALDPTRPDFGPGLRYGAKSLAPLADESSSVASLLQEAPADFRTIEASLSTTDTVLGHASHFARAATAFTALAPRALNSLTDVLTRGRAGVTSAGGLLKQVQPAISPTEALTSTLNPELPHLSRLFSTLDPVLTTLSPYDCDFAGFSHNWRGFLGNGATLQPGPLGEQTILRLVVTAPGIGIGSASGLPQTFNANPKPCIGTGGP